MENEVLFRAIINDEIIENIYPKDLNNAQLFATQEVDKYILRCNGVNYSVTLEGTNPQKKEYVIKVGGLRYQIQLQDKLDMLIQDMGLNKRGEPSHKNLPAPMPGLVLDVMVSENDPIKKGDVLLVLEAMKMENVILAPQDGIIYEIYVKKGDVVEKGAILLELD